jgi:cytochrome c55X
MKMRFHTLTLLVALSLFPLLGHCGTGLEQDRQQQLIYLLRQDCGSCHGMRLTGGLGPSLVPELMLQRPDAYLRAVISDGIPDTAMPPWSNILEPEEINFIIAQLKQPTVTPAP